VARLFCLGLIKFKMQKIVFEKKFNVFLDNKLKNMARSIRPLKIFVAFLSLVLVCLHPIQPSRAQAESLVSSPEITFNKVKFKNLISETLEDQSLSSEQVNFVPMTIKEKEFAEDLESSWVWPEYTLDMIDSYSPFLFRTKKSREYEEVKVLVMVNNRGKVSGYELLTDLDNGTKERMDYLIRKLPVCKAVPGYPSYSSTTFELTIRKE
jgi:hypothetical protein